MPSLTRKAKTPEPMPLSSMDCSTLQDTLARYPYYDMARVLLLRKLYEQRDPAYNEELRTAALYLPSRHTLFDFAEGEKMRPQRKEGNARTGAIQAHKPNSRLNTQNETEEQKPRTLQLIEGFLDSIPNALTDRKRPRKRPTVDSSVDYISYMLQEEEEDRRKETPLQTEPQKTQNDELLDNFINEKGDRRIRLDDNTETERPQTKDTEETTEKSTFTETLAQIYIKQGKFEQAIEIIQRLSLKYPKKNRYFADQIRFLEKVLVNQRANTK